MYMHMSSQALVVFYQEPVSNYLILLIVELFPGVEHLQATGNLVDSSPSGRHIHYLLDIALNYTMLQSAMAITYLT
jgi:hypothetical protein